jgi:hypothetical protein
MVMSEFYAYDNHHRDRARVHRGDCPWCNHGRGVQGVPAASMTNGTGRLALLRTRMPGSAIALMSVTVLSAGRRARGLHMADRSGLPTEEVGLTAIQNSRSAAPPSSLAGQPRNCRLLE